MQDKQVLTRRQLHVLPFLIINPTVEIASKQSGVSPKQIFEWLNQPTFRQELENRKNEAVNQAVDRLKQTAVKAVDTLVDLLDNAKTDSVKHRVAVDVLNMTIRFMEFKDIEQRIRKLEDAATM